MIEKKFGARVDNLHHVLEFLESELENHECSMKISTALAIAIEELFVNVASYSYPDGEGDCTLKIDFDGDDCIMTLIDKGIPFDPVAKTDPDISLSAEERDIGGLGILMVKKTMDDMRYERKDDQNILVMRKRIK